MGEHKSDEFGHPTPTVFGANLNDPDLTAYSSPAMIRLAGVDEQATASKRIAPATPQPGVARVPLWVWIVVLVVMFLAGLVGLYLGNRSGFFRSPNPYPAAQQRYSAERQKLES